MKNVKKFFKKSVTKAENSKEKKSSKIKAAAVGTAVTLKDHKEELKTMAIVVMAIVIIALLMRKPETVYQEIPVEVEKQIVVEVPVQEEKEDNNVRN